MEFNLKKLEQDFFVEYDKKENRLSIYPRIGSDTVNEYIDEIGGYLGLDENETDEIRGAVHRVHIMSVLRKCSRW
jgi:hypothetical protein